MYATNVKNKTKQNKLQYKDKNDWLSKDQSV